MRRFILILLLTVAFSPIYIVADERWYTDIPEISTFTNVVVKDDEPAIKLAVLYISYYFGDATANRFEPYEYHEQDGICIIKGTLPSKGFGFAPYVEIKKSNGELLKLIYHGKTDK